MKPRVLGVLGPLLSATAVLALLAVPGCGGGSDAVADATPGGGDAGGRDGGDDPLDLPPPTNGFQVRSVGTTIEAGEDVEYCEVAQIPGTPDEIYYVNRLEFAMSASSHHLIVTAAEPGSELADSLTVGDRVRCPIGARIFGDGFISVGGSQQPYHEDSLPDGIGRVFHGGQKLVFDYHYFNPGDAPVPARAAANFHRVDSIEKEARQFGFYNFSIATPAGEARSFNAGCTFDHDVIVQKVTRHTHQWTNDFDVWFRGGERDGEHIWTSDHYEDVDHAFPEPILVRAGEGFQFECDIDNTTDHSLGFGITAQDEMCILFGMLWNPDDSPVEDIQCAAVP